MPLTCVVAVFLCAACSGRQDPQMVLYEAETSDRAVTPDPALAFSGTFTTGVEGRQVPLRVRWTAGRDAAGCLRIATVRVERTGGDPRLHISNVRQDATQCGMEWESDDTTRFETALISLDYRTRKGIRTYDFSGHVANISGTGQLRSQ
jgi:hypothetical protein